MASLDGGSLWRRSFTLPAESSAKPVGKVLQFMLTGLGLLGRSLGMVKLLLRDTKGRGEVKIMIPGLKVES